MVFEGSSNASPLEVELSSLVRAQGVCRRDSVQASILRNCTENRYRINRRPGETVCGGE